MVQAFVVVAEELHFGRAADRLNITPPPLSQMIRKLEHEVGTRLLDRHTRRVALTAAGEAFLGHARRCLDAADAAVAAARRTGAGDAGTVRLGFAGSSSHEELQAIAHRFRSRHPGAVLEPVTGHFSGELAEAVRRHRVDAALLRRPVDETGLRALEISESAIVVALPAGHRLAIQEVVDASELSGEPFISYPANRISVVRGSLDVICQRAGFAPHVVQEAPDTHTLLALVGAGGGVGLVLEPAARLAVPGTVIRPLRPRHVHPLVLVWSDSNPNPALGSLVAAATSLVGPGSRPSPESSP